MEKEKIMQYFALAVIAVFAVEIILPIFTAQNQNVNATPTPIVTAKPTVVPKFAGSAIAKATIDVLYATMVTLCETNASTEEIVNKFSDAGLEKVSFASGNVIVSSPNATTAMEDAEKKLIVNLQGTCAVKPRVMRAAGVSFGETVQLYSNPADPNSASKNVTPRDFYLYSLRENKALQGFISVGRNVNDTVSAVVYAELTGSAITKIYVEEQASAAETLNVLAEGKAEELLSDGVVFAELSWEKRGANLEELKSTSGGFAIKELNYIPSRSIGISGNYSNVSSEIGNLSFVDFAREENGTILVFAKNDFYDSGMALSELEKLGVKKEDVSLPVSKMSVYFNATDFAKAEDAMKKALEGKGAEKISFKRKAIVRFSDKALLERDIGAAIEKDAIQAWVSSATKANETIVLQVTANLQLGELGSMSVQQMELTPA